MSYPDNHYLIGIDITGDSYLIYFKSAELLLRFKSLNLSGGHFSGYFNNSDIFCKTSDLTFIAFCGESFLT